ncbi:MAG: IclR family transcriptional regulator [Verrucomicrobiales bacterium]|jgi:IclR family acetate operon transcriptional repressor|nr:IclR family transcriptional regulator [Verrucomicrobiales bacterium]
MESSSLLSPESSPNLAAPGDSELDSLPSPTGAKTLALLDLLSQHPEGLTATEAVRESGFTHNLVFRILKTLVAMGFALQREDNKAYTLSNRILDLTSPRNGGRSLVFCSQESLRKLRDKTGETAQLLIEVGGKGLILEQFRGTQSLQVSGEVGMRVPLYSCAPGKAILAAWNDDYRDAWYRERGKRLKQFTETTLHRRSDLERELEEIRSCGYAVDRAEGAEGIHCAAAAILDAYGQPLGAVTVMAPIARMTEEEFPQFGKLCRIAADKISRKFRHG